MDLVLKGIHQSNTITADKIGFVALVSQFKGKWIIVQLKESETWEFPGGTIEKGETPLEAAKREMYEETGTVDAEYKELGDYSVTCEGVHSYGKLYFVNVLEMSDLPDFEIDKIDFTENFPYGNTRYPSVQPDLFRYAEKLVLNNSAM